MSAGSRFELSFLVDTNVWIDFFIDRGRNHDAAVTFILASRERDIPLFTSISSTKDVYFSVACELKRMQRTDGGEITEQFANAVDEAAWSCLSTLRKQSIVVAADAGDMVEAMVQRTNHGDYEDNLIIAAAVRASATHIVSSDTKLQRHSPIPCIGLTKALQIVRAKKETQNENVRKTRT